MFNKLDKIEIISDLDHKILWRYEKLLVTLKRIVNIQIVAEVVMVVIPRISYFRYGDCHWNSANTFLNEFMWFISDPLCSLLQICMYLFIFWRKRLGRDSMIFMHQDTDNYGLKSTFTTPQKTVINSIANNGVKTSGILKNSQALKTSAIMLGGSEGDISISFQDSDSSYVDNKKMAEDLENQLYERAIEKSSVAESLPIGSKQHTLGQMNLSPQEESAKVKNLRLDDPDALRLNKKNSLYMDSNSISPTRCVGDVEESYESSGSMKVAPSTMKLSPTRVLQKLFRTNSNPHSFKMPNCPSVVEDLKESNSSTSVNNSVFEFKN